MPSDQQNRSALRHMRGDQRWSLGAVATAAATLTAAVVADDPIIFFGYLAVSIMSTGFLANRVSQRDKAAGDEVEVRGRTGTWLTLGATLVAAASMVAASTIAPEAVMFAALIAPVAFVIRNAWDATVGGKADRKSTKPRDLMMQNLTLGIMLGGLAVMQAMGASMLGAEVKVDGMQALIALGALQLAMAVNTAAGLTAQAAAAGGNATSVGRAIHRQRNAMVFAQVLPVVAIAIMASGAVAGEEALLTIGVSVALSMLTTLVATGYRNYAIERAISSDSGAPKGTDSLLTKIGHIIGHTFAQTVTDVRGDYQPVATGPDRVQETMHAALRCGHEQAVTRRYEEDAASNATMDSPEERLGAHGSEAWQQARIDAIGQVYDGYISGPCQGSTQIARAGLTHLGLQVKNETHEESHNGVAMQTTVERIVDPHLEAWQEDRGEILRSGQTFDGYCDGDGREARESHLHALGFARGDNGELNDVSGEKDFATWVTEAMAEGGWDPMARFSEDASAVATAVEVDGDPDGSRAPRGSICTTS